MNDFIRKHTKDEFDKAKETEKQLLQKSNTSQAKFIAGEPTNAPE
jgi:hypothetical protein